MDDFLVSALVSTYNSEKFIKGCLDDLISQTLYKKNLLEIIVIDSASQQNEAEIVRTYIKNFPNIKYIRTEKREPLYSAWNRGIETAKGKYLTNANTDDRHHPQALEILSDELEKFPNVALVYPNQIITNIENQTFQNCTPTGYTSYPHFDRQHLLYVTYVGHQPMWRRTLHNEFGFFRQDLKIAGDYEWWLRISEKYTFKHIPLLLGLYFYNQMGLERENSEACRVETSEVRTFYQIRANKIALENFYRTNYYLNRHFDFYSIEPKNPDVSFIVIHNSSPQKTILTTNTILNQTFLNLEILIITPKKDLSFLNDYFRFDKRVKFIEIDQELTTHEKITLGVQKSSGKIISILFDHNRLFPSFTQYGIDSFNQNSNVVVAFFNFYEVKFEDETLNQRELERHKYSFKDYLQIIPKFPRNEFFPLLAKKAFLTTVTIKSLVESPLSFLNSINSVEISTPLIEIYSTKENYEKIKYSKEKITDEKPKVSIIIPCYNLAPYLSEAVESIINQTFQNWECIIVNDGSTDNTREVAFNLIQKYSNKNIKYLEKTNEGVSIARNYGITHSLGEYILPLDADDLLHSQFLEKTVNLLEKNLEVHIAYTDQKHFGFSEQYVPSLDWDPLIETKFNYIGNSTLYRKVVWETVGGYKKGIGYEDWEFWISAIEKGFTGKRIPEPLFFHRVRKGSRFQEDLEKDIINKSQIIQYHPLLFTEKQFEWAKSVNSNKNFNTPFKNLTNYIPEFVNLDQKVELKNFRVLALISTSDLENFSEYSITNLIEQGIDTYLLYSKYDEVKIQNISKFLNKGLVQIEQFDEQIKNSTTTKNQLELILKKKIDLARELDYDWFISLDLNEFLESPFSWVSLKESIFLVDSLGYNTIFSELPDYDLSKEYAYYLDNKTDSNQIFNFLLLKGWKKSLNFDFNYSTNPQAGFPDQRLFPIPFVLYHFPLQYDSIENFNFNCESNNPQIRESRTSEKPITLINLEPAYVENLLKFQNKTISEFSLAILLTNLISNFNINTINLENFTKFIAKFHNQNEKVINEICIAVESNLDTFLKSNLEAIAWQLILKVPYETLQIIQEYLSLKYCHFLTIGKISQARKIKELVLLLQNKVVLKSPFINFIGYPENLHSKKILSDNKTKSNISLEADSFCEYPKLKIQDLFENNRIEEAKNIIENYLVIDENNIDALNDLAIIKSLGGETDEAIQLFNKILSIDPENQIAKENLATLSGNLK
ncbi:MAG: glycosyltransferase [Ignavibacteria bacterium]|nr:glycosyltransferase [Ignavibacteria bacterium]